jgi:hypothetical protein
MRIITPAIFLSASILAGCTTTSSGTTPGDDELAGETGDGEQPKADGADTFGIYTAQKVGAFECNGAGSCTHVDLARANRSTTSCADGTTADHCEVRTLDFSALGLTSSKLDSLMSKLQASAADPTVGPQLLVRGKYVHGTNALYPGVDWVTFQVSEVWAAVISDGAVDGTFVMVADNGRRCIDSPCGSITEGRVNSVRSMDIDGLDFGDHDSVSDKVYTATRQPDGAIVVGNRTHGQLMHLPTTLRSVEQAYLRVK